MVDSDAIFPMSGQTSVLYPCWLIFIFLNKPQAYTGKTYCQAYYTPQCCKSRILEDLTDISIKGPTITLEYRENVSPRNKRRCF